MVPVIAIVGALTTFGLVVRVYSTELRQGRLTYDWDEPTIFGFAVLMGVIWPLTIIWLLARRRTRTERRKASRVELLNEAAETEWQARVLGIGKEEDQP